MVNKVDFVQTSKSTSAKNSAKKSNDSTFQDTYEQTVQNKKDSAQQVDKPEDNTETQTEDALKSNVLPEFVMAMPFFFQMNVQDFAQLETQVVQTLETMYQEINLSADVSARPVQMQNEALPHIENVATDVVVLSQVEGEFADSAIPNLQENPGGMQQTENMADSLMSGENSGGTKQKHSEELMMSKTSLENTTSEQLQKAALEVQNAPAEQKNDTIHLQKSQKTEHTARNTIAADEGVTLPKLPDKILTQIVNGRHEFEVNLEPKDLGKLTIKATFENGKAIVSIFCSSAKTLEVLSSHAREVGAILESNLGSPTNIVLDKNPPQQSEPNYTDDQSHNNGQQEQSNQQNKQEQHQHAPKDSFLQQLRLGLI